MGVWLIECKIAIKARVNEALYIMKGFKYGKYQLQESTKKDGVTTVEALAIAAPSPDGLPHFRVIHIPSRDKNEKPISNYKKGSYSIVN